MNTAIITLKKQLRKDMTARLEQLSTIELKRQSDEVFQKLQELDCFKKSQNISIYISMPTCEIMTTEIIHHVLTTGKNCFIPRCTKSTMDMVKLASLEDFNSLPMNKWNIPEPRLDEPRENALDENGLDLILVPGVAFDKNKNRIGHGKGYYDRYIKKCNAWADEHGSQRPKTVALALNEQVVNEDIIPVEETDQKIDCILTPKSIIC
ncbi:5-formyltetrahydrofolate cyclo-ligase-like protein [Cokeromyces recurvatus]|uniref:5-formyltetrahydrofolate cyclo-ligase-like protein n=1 Tax=Cokeromyces recurvatus TaxID=90255 RepID=UPI002220FEBB|nr:5-formyltetrahydrofolate cyclo-ligase-like protein [Cokeromyces recurvatus]KAI7902294.1 5-formyltetrahydrofolate cyclo-ligase-like protein [Cokeromyces recurvatus]